tara:strand:+ start:858 stop:1436 length:579 start_codon:yes stop_codon:yes gene_type:complete
MNIEKMQRDYEMFKALCENLGERSQAVNDLLTHVEERLVTCPSSERTEYFNSFPGGLLDHALKILDASYKLVKAHDAKLPKESIILCSLFCLIGKVGDENQDLYLPQDNDWRRDKLGENYKFNPELRHMRATHRSLYLLQKFGVDLTQEEWLAILLADGLTDDTRLYSMREPTLALVISSANKLVMAADRER